MHTHAYNTDQGDPVLLLVAAETVPSTFLMVLSAGSSRSVLDAFFYGRAFAEVLNEKLGEVADDVLVRVSKLDAERQQAFRWATHMQ